MPDRIRLTEENRKWWTLGAMCFALFMIMLDNTVVNVALPSIQRDLGVDLAELEWIVTARLQGLESYAATLSDDQRAALMAALVELPHKKDHA